MSDFKIQQAIDNYLQVRHELLLLGQEHPARIGGNDNIIGRIGEFIALRFLESLGQRPTKVEGSSNPGYDLIEGTLQTQVKVMTEENQRGRNVRLTEPWNQLVLIELGEHYKPKRIGLLTRAQHLQSCQENKTWSSTPYVKRTMLGPKGLIGRYGRVYTGSEVAV
jgi:hypothetical protein